MKMIHLVPAAATFNGALYNAALANLFPISDVRSKFAAAFGARLQHFSLWNIEDEQTESAVRARLMDAVLIANGVRVQVIALRLASVMMPALAAIRTAEVDITLDALETLSARLAEAAGQMIANGDLYPEILLASCNTLDGTLENLKIEAQYLCIQVQENGQAN